MAVRAVCPLPVPLCVCLSACLFHCAAGCLYVRSSVSRAYERLLISYFFDIYFSFSVSVFYYFFSLLAFLSRRRLLNSTMTAHESQPCRKLQLELLLGLRRRRRCRLQFLLRLPLGIGALRTHRLVRRRVGAAAAGVAGDADGDGVAGAAEDGVVMVVYPLLTLQGEIIAIILTNDPFERGASSGRFVQIHSVCWQLLLT